MIYSIDNNNKIDNYKNEMKGEREAVEDGEDEKIMVNDDV